MAKADAARIEALAYEMLTTGLQAYIVGRDDKQIARLFGCKEDEVPAVIAKARSLLNILPKLGLIGDRPPTEKERAIGQSLQGEAAKALELEAPISEPVANFKYPSILVPVPTFTSYGVGDTRGLNEEQIAELERHSK